jgi:hypothetical protein
MNAQWSPILFALISCGSALMLRTWAARIGAHAPRLAYCVADPRQRLSLRVAR